MLYSEFSWNYLAPICLLYCGYYFTYYGKSDSKLVHFVQKPRVYKQESSLLSKFLTSYVVSLNKKYWSLFWVPGGRLQTVLASLLPRNCGIKYKRETVLTPDGGQFSLSWATAPEDSNAVKPLVVICPGLMSTSQTGYVQILVKEILSHGFDVVVIVNRGLEVPFLNGISFCGSCTKDFKQAFTVIRERCPSSPIAALGISLGGLLLTRYLAETGEDSKLNGAFVYCCPFNPVVGSARIEQWDYWLLYNVSLTRELKQMYYKYANLFAGTVDHKKMKKTRSIREFDSEFTAKVFGYQSVDHYYEDSVITPGMLQSIKTPTLCLCADDDAFVPPEGIPLQEISRTDYVALAMTNGGGHVAHLQGLNPMSKPFFCSVFMDFVRGVFMHGDELPGTTLKFGTN